MANYNVIKYIYISVHDAYTFEYRLDGRVFDFCFNGLIKKWR